jgi:23S rRNA pseudouridine2605 synthase
MREEIRLQKYIASCGVSSRRKAEELIRDGRITVDGHVVTEMGFKVPPGSDVRIDHKRIAPEKESVYIALNKPAGYATTSQDPFARNTVLELVDGLKERVFPVGRLDKDTTGLIFLTNDGDFAYRLTHPSRSPAKVYSALVKGVPEVDTLDRLSAGVVIDGYRTRPARFELAEVRDGNARLAITLHEGRNRQIRKMCESVGHPVLRLSRTAIGGVTLGDLKEGAWRRLSPGEIRLFD